MERKGKTEKGRGASNKHCTDAIARRVYSTLASDFRSITGRGDFCRQAEVSLYTDMSLFRETEETLMYWYDVHWFKIKYQMNSLFKKYRFHVDARDSDELERSTLAKFEAHQEKLGAIHVRSTRANMVIKKARKIIKSILGDFDSDELTIDMKVGSKSHIGCPLSQAYLDLKLSCQEGFTSTRAAADWFVKTYLPLDPILSRLLKSCGLKEVTAAEVLKLVLVPKSWKTLRLITPLAMVNLFYSYGYSKMVERRLSKAGLNIKTLQQRHRKLVKRFSQSLRYATVDLSSASDSLVRWLLIALLPRKWWNALKGCLTKVMTVNGRSLECLTALPMGNAATFPIETLVFYALTDAIRQLLELGGFTSCYGDDIICRSEIVPYMEEVFPEMGLFLNREKTFTKTCFRESCGADYYRGVSVRPFFFPGESAKLTRSKYEAYLYKVYNGLRSKWSEEEIPQTLRMLIIEISMISTRSGILRVPRHYSDEAGIKTSDPFEIPLGMDYAPWSDVSRIQGVRIGTLRVKSDEDPSKTVVCEYFDSELQFKCLVAKPRQRRVIQSEPWYWDTLRITKDRIFRSSVMNKVIRSPFLMKHFGWRKINVYLSDNVAPLKRLFVQKNGYKRRYLFVDVIDSTSYQTETTSVAIWC